MSFPTIPIFFLPAPIVWRQKGNVFRALRSPFDGQNYWEGTGLWSAHPPTFMPVIINFELPFVRWRKRKHPRTLDFVTNNELGLACVVWPVWMPDGKRLGRAEWSLTAIISFTFLFNYFGLVAGISSLPLPRPPRLLNFLRADNSVISPKNEISIRHTEAQLPGWRTDKLTSWLTV